MTAHPYNILKDRSLRGPGLLESLAESLLGARRPLDCVQIEVTSHCPGKCVYCPHTTASNWQGRFLKPATFARIWPLLRRSARAHLQGWGEPFLHRQFFDYVALARKAGCQVSSTSCGLNINDETADRIAKSGMDYLAISLVGADPASNAPRAGIDFDSLSANVQRLANAIRKSAQGPELHIAYLMLADRMEAVRDLPELMASWGVSVAVVSTLDYLAVPSHAEWAFAPQEREKIESARHILAQTAARAAEMGIAVRYALPGKSPRESCRENTARTVYVDAGGDISPCVYLNVPDPDAGKRRIFGNVLENDAWQIWQALEFAAFRAQVGEQDCPQECVDCPKRFEEDQI